MFWENSIETSILSRSPAQVGCMRQVLRAGALGRPRGEGWGGRRAGGSGWGTHVNPWLIHVSVWQKLLPYCKVISLQLIKINGKKIKYFCGSLDIFYFSNKLLKEYSFIWKIMKSIGHFCWKHDIGVNKLSNSHIIQFLEGKACSYF